MGKCGVWIEDGKCLVEDSNTGTAPGHSVLGSLNGDVQINNPVGLASPNVYDDVFKIQYALNRIPPIDGGPVPLLEIDGKCGPKTIKAIQNFQLKHFGWKGADGKVEPNRQTIAKLNEIGKRYGAHPAVPLDHVADAWLLEAMLIHLPYTKECVRAARENVFRAMLAVENPGDSAADIALREQRLALTKRHFKVDQVKLKTPFLQDIHERLSRMMIVLNNPEIYFALDVDDSGTKINSRIAQAPLSGYFMEDTSRRIEFRRGAYFASQNRDFTTHIIVHEMTHFTEPRDAEGHFGISWPGDPKMEALKPTQCAANCHTFANFSLEARNGVMSKPPWMRS